MIRSSKISAAAAAGIALAGCSGLSPPSGSSGAFPPADDTVSIAAGSETSQATTIIRLSSGAAVALFPDSNVYYSPDGYNLGGGGSTVSAYTGSLQVVSIAAVGTGVEALLADGTAYFSPDGKNLGGGGSSVNAYGGGSSVASITSVEGGIDAVLSNGGGAYFSPDGKNLGGGGSSVRIYAGQANIVQIIPVGSGAGVVTLLDSGAAYFSSNNRDIGGGGSTVSAAPNAKQAIVKLFQVGGGVLTQFADGSVYLSANGQNLAGGGATVYVSAWNTSIANGPFGPRDSAPGIVFGGRLWLSGGYAIPSYADSCFLTCSYFDLWSSQDLSGATWSSAPSFATATTPDPRDATAGMNGGVEDAPVPTDFYDSYAPVVLWNGRMFAIGGSVWSSADGVHWAQELLADGITPAPGPLSSRASEDSHSVVSGTSIFFMQSDTGEVYSTSDPKAISWTALGAIPGYTPRCGAAMFVLQGKIWVEGGGACDYSKVYNDVWSSADGVNWTKSASAAQWSGRMWPCVASSNDGVVWFAGGYAPTDWNASNGVVTRRYARNHSDVWYTKDGNSWRQYKADFGSSLPDGSSLEARHAPTCYAAGDTAATQSLIVVAGTGGTNPDDNDARTLNSIRTLSLPVAASLP